MKTRIRVQELSEDELKEKARLFTLSQAKEIETLTEEQKFSYLVLLVNDLICLAFKSFVPREYWRNALEDMANANYATLSETKLPSDLEH